MRPTFFARQFLSSVTSAKATIPHDDVAIVGCGTGGLSALIHQIDEAERRNVKNFSIRLFEKNEIAGSGRPWYPTQDYVLRVNDLNKDMIIDTKKPDDFIEWLYGGEFARRHPELAAAKADEIAEDKNFGPRALFGIYCLDRRDDTIERAKKLGIKVIIDSKTNIIKAKRMNDQSWCLTSEDGKSYRTDNFMATVGHLPSDVLKHLRSHKKAKSRVISPLKEEFYRIDWTKVKKVFIAGSGLTFVDATNKLKKAGFTGEIIAISPSAHLPRIKNPPADDVYQLKHLTAHALLAIPNFTLEDHVLPLLAKEMSACTGIELTKQTMLRIARNTGNDPIKTLKTELKSVHAGQIRDWHRALTKAYFDILPVLQNLSNADKDVFMKIYYPLYLKWMAAMTPINAEKILPLLETQQVRIRKGKDTDILYDEASDQFTFKSENETYTAEMVIDAVGTGRDPLRHPLLRSMIEDGNMCVNPNAGIRISPQCHVQAKDGSFHHNCFAYGPATLESDFAAYSVERGAICGKMTAPFVLDNIVTQQALQGAHKGTLIQQRSRL